MKEGMCDERGGDTCRKRCGGNEGGVKVGRAICGVRVT